MQRSDLRPSESGWGGTMDLGSALARLGWPVMGAQTVWVRGFAAARLLLAAGEASEDLPRVRIRGWPEFAGNSNSPNLFFWSTFNGHNAIAFSWTGLQRIPEVLFIHIPLFLSFQTVVSQVDRLLKPPESQPLRNPPALSR